jgi:hypothetical protein
MDKYRGFMQNFAILKTTSKLSNFLFSLQPKLEKSRVEKSAMAKKAVIKQSSHHQ